MAKCKFGGTPFYKVQVGDKQVQFDYFGRYETDKEDELEVLHGLVPKYIKEVEHAEPKAEVKAEPKAKAKPKKGEKEVKAEEGKPEDKPSDK